ncbi:MAG: hypothetical protein ABFR75_05510 [Acidobacteriota bacterium]
MKKLLIISVLAALLILPANGEIAVKIGGLFSGAFNIDDFTYSTNYEDDVVSFSEQNSSLFSGKGGIGLNAGISFFFNYHMGVGLNISILKSTFDISNSFNWNFSWWNGNTGDINPKTWQNEGTISSIPVSLNLIYRVVSKEKLKANVFFGPTLYMATLDLDGNGGYADGPLLSDGFYYVDWYDIPLTLTGSHTVLGGNGGFEVEYLFSDNMAVYFGATYYFAGKIKEYWKVKTGKYTGEFGSLVGTISNEDLLDGYIPAINLSSLTFGAGIKVFL